MNAGVVRKIPNLIYDFVSLKTNTGIYICKLRIYISAGLPLKFGLLTILHLVHNPEKEKRLFPFSVKPKYSFINCSR